MWTVLDGSEKDAGVGKQTVMVIPRVPVLAAGAYLFREVVMCNWFSRTEY